MRSGTYQLIGFAMLLAFAGAFDIVIYHLGASLVLCAMLFIVQAILSLLMFGSSNR